MCPLCIGTAAWLISGGTSGGGIVALLLTRRTRKNGSIDAHAGRRDGVTAENAAASLRMSTNHQGRLRVDPQCCSLPAAAPQC